MAIDGAAELDAWLASLPDKLARELARRFADAVEDELVAPIRAAAPQGPTGRLKASVRKTKGRDDFEWIVAAGGALTTKFIRAQAVGVEYDYALGVEFGNSHVPAEPFFWPTVRAQWPALQDRVDAILSEAIEKVGG